MSVNIHVLNATGALNNKIPAITSALRAATRVAKQRLQLENADIVVSSNPNYTIPELGVGGYTDSANKVVYVSLDPNVTVPDRTIEACLHHEYYHLARHQRIGVPVTLLDRTIDEGLACMYEFEVTGKVPIYAGQTISDSHLSLFAKHAGDKNDTDKWFFGGGHILRWFAYSLGFKLVDSYKSHTNKTATQMIGIKNSVLFRQALKHAELPGLN
jgi:uncharacterized protein YjaZ